MNLNGIIVEWLKDKSEIDLNNPIELVDYRVVMPNKLYPRSDGQPVTFDGYPNYEWLTKVDAPQPPYDNRFDILLVKNYPSQTPDVTNPLIMTYTQSYGTERRPLESIIASIRQEEQAANNSLYGECDPTKMGIFCNSYNTTVADGGTPSEAEVNAVTRNADVLVKILKNTNNATDLISSVTAGYSPDITEGWEKDNILPSFPFSN